MGGRFGFRLGVRVRIWYFLPSTLAQVSGAIGAGCVCTAESGPHHGGPLPCEKVLCDFYENFTKNRLKMGVLQRPGWEGSHKNSNC